MSHPNVTKRFGQCFVFLLLLSAFPALLMAASVTIDGVLNVELGSHVYQLRGGTASSVVVGTSSFTITTASGESVVVSSSLGKKLTNSANIPTQCFTGEARLTVPANASVVFTPTGDIFCSSSGGGGGGSGGGSSSSSSSGSTAAGAAMSGPTAATNPTALKPAAPKEKSMFSDIDDLSGIDKKKILDLVKLMMSQNTFAKPSDDKFGPLYVVKGNFALNVLNAVAGIGCGSDEGYPGMKRCLETARAEHIVSSTFKLNAKTTRAEFYRALLKARGVELIDSNSEYLATYCNDAQDGDDELAKVFATAKRYRIAVMYKGGTCRLDVPFSRLEAVRFAAKALTVKKK